MDRHPATPFDSLLRDEAGVTAIEYGLLAALIAVAIVGAIAATGNSVQALYAAWSGSLLRVLPSAQ